MGRMVKALTLIVTLMLPVISLAEETYTLDQAFNRMYATAELYEKVASDCKIELQVYDGEQVDHCQLYAKFISSQDFRRLQIFLKNDDMKRYVSDQLQRTDPVRSFTFMQSLQSATDSVNFIKQYIELKSQD